MKKEGQEAEGCCESFSTKLMRQYDGGSSFCWSLIEIGANNVTEKLTHGFL